MTIVKTYCDKCGCELVELDHYDDLSIEIANYLKEVDLCCKCFEKLTDHIENFFEERETDDEQR